MSLYMENNVSITTNYFVFILFATPVTLKKNKWSAFKPLASLTRAITNKLELERILIK